MEKIEIEGKETKDKEEANEPVSLPMFIIIYIISVLLLCFCYFVYDDPYRINDLEGGSGRGSNKIVFWLKFLWNRPVATIGGLLGALTFFGLICDVFKEKCFKKGIAFVLITALSGYYFFGPSEVIPGEQEYNASLTELIDTEGKYAFGNNESALNLSSSFLESYKTFVSVMAGKNSGIHPPKFRTYFHLNQDHTFAVLVYSPQFSDFKEEDLTTLAKFAKAQANVNYEKVERFKGKKYFVVVHASKRRGIIIEGKVGNEAKDYSVLEFSELHKVYECLSSKKHE